MLLTADRDDDLDAVSHIIFVQKIPNQIMKFHMDLMCMSSS